MRKSSILFLAAFGIAACSNRYVIYPNDHMNLKPGDRIAVSTVTDSIYQDQVLEEGKDSITCAKRTFRKDDVSKVEKNEVSVPKTIGLAAGVGAGIVVLPFLLILFGVATGMIPFDN